MSTWHCGHKNKIFKLSEGKYLRNVDILLRLEDFRIEGLRVVEVIGFKGLGCFIVSGTT